MVRTINDLINAISSQLSYEEVLAAEQMAKISAAITKERIDRDLTQAEFAKLLGVSQGMVSKWESEEYNFTIESLAGICDKLDWDMNIELTPRPFDGYSQKRNGYSLNWNNENSNVIDFKGVA